MKKIVMLLASACLTAVVHAAGVTVHLKLDCRTGDGMTVESPVDLCYSPIGAGAVTLTVDDEEILYSTNAGVFAWRPAAPGTHVVKHIAGENVWARTVEVTATDYYEEPSPNPPGKKDTTLTLASLEKTFVSPETGVGSFAVTSTQGSRTWTALSSDSSWIRVMAESGVAGTDKVQYVVESNTNAAARTGYVYVSGHVHTVIQPGRGATVSPLLITAMSEGTAQDLYVDAGAGVSWNAKPDSEWISVLPTQGLGSGQTTVRVASCHEVKMRCGMVTIAGQAVSVVQRGREMKVDVDSMNCTHEAQSLTLDVTALSDVTWAVTPQVDWLSVSHSGAWLGSSTFSLNVVKNESYLPRTGTVRVGAEVVTVTQGGCTALTFDLSESTSSIPAERTVDRYVQVMATPDLPWMVSPKNEWISVSEIDKSRAGTGSVAYSIEANPNLASRTGTIVFMPDPASKMPTRTLTVTQATAVASLDSDGETVAAAESQVVISVMADPVVKWSVDGLPSWVTLSGTSARTGAGSVVLCVSENTTTAARQCVLSIAGHSFTLRQEGGVVGLARAHDIGVPEGGIVYLDVMGAQNLNWTIANVPAWVTIEGGLARKGSSTLAIRFKANPTIDARMCEINIGGQVWTFVQTAVEPLIDEDIFIHGAVADFGTIGISAPSHLSYEVSTEDDWISIYGNTMLSGTNEVFYIVDDMDLHDARVGVISIGRTPVYISQCGYSVEMDTSEIVLPRFESQGTIPFIVGEIDNENRWAAIVTEDWLTLRKYTGIGNGALRYDCAANTTGVTRVGRILMCNQIVTITQYGQNELQTERSIFYSGLMGATHGNPTTYFEGQKIVFAAPQPIGGYKFVGWSPAEITSETTGDLSVVAKWTTNVYEIVFNANGGTGEMANQVFRYGEAKPITTCGLSYAGYDFAGWAVHEDASSADWVDGAVVSNLTTEADGVVTLYAVWTRHIWTIAEALNATGLTFVTGGDAPAWYVDGLDGHDCIVSVRSGAIGDSQTNWIETVVSGPGTVSFWWKASGEFEVSKKGVVTLYDYAEFTVDGVPVAEIGADSSWTEEIQAIEGAGTHTLRWMYHKDESGSGGDDCAWLSEVAWVPDSVSTDPIPELDNPTEKQVKEVMEQAKDKKLASEITNGTEYAEFREWAGQVKGSGGETAGSAAVMESEHAWQSYALRMEKLLEAAIEDKDLKVEEFKPTAKAGKFEFTVSVDGVDVGSEVSKENLKKVFGLEGASELGVAQGEGALPTIGSGFSANCVDISFDTPVDGKVKFTAGPNDTDAKAFFMKVKVK